LSDNNIFNDTEHRAASFLLLILTHLFQQSYPDIIL